MKLSERQLAWVNETLARMAKKMEKVRERSAEKIPYDTKDGIHVDKSDERNISWWTNGFWGGMMWQMHALTREERYKEIARWSEEKLDTCFLHFDMLDHDNGFKWLPTAVADYRVTGCERSKKRGLLAAEILAGRYNPAGKFIRAWNDIPGQDSDTRGWAIIDCMFNIPLLYWASEETDDPRFKKIAQIHADTVAKHFVREDGSVRHIVEFDPDTGAFVRDYGGQGYAQGSSWTRGQTWGLYGFTMSYNHTNAVRYLAMAEKIASYFIAHIPADGKIPVDFCQPEEPKLYDDIAAAVAACGLIELARLVPERSGTYLEPALKLLHVLDETADWNPDTDGFLQNCSADYHGTMHNVNYTYGDYYFYEALLKLTGQELYIW